MQSITRRAALAGIASIPAIGSAGPATKVDLSLTALEALIARHTASMETDRAAWNSIPDDDDARRPDVRVQIGRLLRGRDIDTGEDVFEPIYAPSDEAIEQKYEQNLRASLSLYGHTPGSADRIRRDHGEWLTVKKAELAQLQAADKLILDEIGHTAAMSKAESSAQALKAVEAEIIAFRPASLAAACRLAAWAFEMIVNDDWSYIDKDQAAPILKSIAAAQKGTVAS